MGDAAVQVVRTSPGVVTTDPAGNVIAETPGGTYVEAAPKPKDKTLPILAALVGAYLLLS